jgi:hypothetical protein
MQRLAGRLITPNWLPQSPAAAERRRAAQPAVLLRCMESSSPGFAAAVATKGACRPVRRQERRGERPSTTDGQDPGGEPHDRVIHEGAQ